VGTRRVGLYPAPVLKARGQRLRIKSGFVVCVSEFAGCLDDCLVRQAAASAGAGLLHPVAEKEPKRWSLRF
jgi:hypothetical protein